jgi:hypothetical protein
LRRRLTLLTQMYRALNSPVLQVAHIRRDVLREVSIADPWL